MQWNNFNGAPIFAMTFATLGVTSKENKNICYRSKQSTAPYAIFSVLYNGVCFSSFFISED